MYFKMLIEVHLTCLRICDTAGLSIMALFNTANQGFHLAMNVVGAMSRL